MKKVALVAHSFHQKTKSSDFFYDILLSEYEIVRYYIDPEDTVDFERISRIEEETIILWQVDYLAAYFLAEGRAVIVCPMFDASGWLPADHFRLINRASFVNFSYILHSRCLQAGARSIYLKYFPDPSQHEMVGDWSANRVFFWRRRPELGIDIGRLTELLGWSFAKLHIHDVPDIDLPTLRENDVREMVGPSVEVTFSHWVESREQFADLIGQANVYFAPRPAEGIGMGFLEAMARGMAVVAPDAPTHSEYIASGVNGSLYLPDRAGERVDLSQAKRLGRWARETIEIGHADWLRARQQVVGFVGESAKSGLWKIPQLSRFSKNVVEAQRRGPEFYNTFVVARRTSVAAAVFSKDGDDDSLWQDPELVDKLWKDEEDIQQAGRKRSEEIPVEDVVHVGKIVSDQERYTGLYMNFKFIPGQIFLGIDIGVHLFVYESVPGLILREGDGGFRLFGGRLPRVEEDEWGKFVRVFFRNASSKPEGIFPGWDIDAIRNVATMLERICLRLEFVDTLSLAPIAHEGFTRLDWVDVAARSLHRTKEALSSLEARRDGPESESDVDSA